MVLAILHFYSIDTLLVDHGMSALAILLYKYVFCSVGEVPAALK